MGRWGVGEDGDREEEVGQGEQISLQTSVLVGQTFTRTDRVCQVS